MDGLRDFLLERIHDEEAAAQAAIDAHPTGYVWTSTDDPDSEHFNRWNPWRVLQSCVAKRLIIAAHRDVGAGLDRRAEPERMLKAHACSTCGQYDEYAIEWPCYTLRVLALDWVDHPAYRPEWRPQRLSSGVGRAPATNSQPAPRRTPAQAPTVPPQGPARAPGETTPVRAPGQPAA